MDETKYQTGGHTKVQCDLIAEGLKMLLDVRSGQESPDLQVVGDVADLLEEFGDPEANMIRLDE